MLCPRRSSSAVHGLEDGDRLPHWPARASANARSPSCCWRSASRAQRLALATPAAPTSSRALNAASAARNGARSRDHAAVVLGDRPFSWSSRSTRRVAACSDEHSYSSSREHRIVFHLERAARAALRGGGVSPRARCGPREARAGQQRIARGVALASRGRVAKVPSEEPWLRVAAGERGERQQVEQTSSAGERCPARAHAGHSRLRVVAIPDRPRAREQCQELGVVWARASARSTRSERT
jgi:hypothetical protein